MAQEGVRISSSTGSIGAYTRPGPKSTISTTICSNTT